MEKKCLLLLSRVFFWILPQKFAFNAEGFADAIFFAYKDMLDTGVTWKGEILSFKKLILLAMYNVGVKACDIEIADSGSFWLVLDKEVSGKEIRVIVKYKDVHYALEKFLDPGRLYVRDQEVASCPADKGSNSRIIGTEENNNYLCPHKLKDYETNIQGNHGDSGESGNDNTFAPLPHATT